VNQSQPAEAPFGRPQAPDVGEHQPTGVADDDVVDLPRAMHERADLASGLVGRLRERRGELRARKLRQRDAAPVDAL
jgi:hypothetical protein